MSTADRVPVRKTYKLFIGGEFPRSESGRSYAAEGAWVARASRKDLRDAVRVARGASEAWAARTAYNRAQVLYRVAEIMEGRRQQFVDEGAGAAEVDDAIDRWVWYAGWADKVQQVVGTVNPVAGPFFDFTVSEPVGVVGVAAPEAPALLGLVSRLAPVLAGGNVAVVLASESAPRSAVTLAEVLATSDVPPGVVGVLTGYKAELLPWLAAHRDVDAIDLTGAPGELLAALEEAAADSVKRVVRAAAPLGESPADVVAFLEAKTVWHPIGQ
ncbi:MAG TPA: aldehyde dehydrogenase family protein [Acidimicrobiales bacterium]|nr:aldehyde dehydrogenase family protein [Acidimicrobiales bacterium]